MPEVQNAVRPTLEPRTIDRIRLSSTNREQERRQVRRVILQVRILDDDRVASVDLDAGADRGAFAAVLRVMNHPIYEPRFGQPIEDFPGPVGRGVVDGDDLQPKRDLTDAAQCELDGRDLVVCRHDHRQQHVGRTALLPHYAASPIAISDCPTRHGRKRSNRNSGTSASYSLSEPTGIVSRRRTLPAHHQPGIPAMLKYSICGTRNPVARSSSSRPVRV